MNGRLQRALRMAVIGQQITSAEEVASARPALAAEADRLTMRAGRTVLTICGTYRPRGRTHTVSGG